MNNKRINTLVVGAALAAVILTACLASIAATPAAYCFKPGATVTVQYFFTVPADFHLGEDPLAGVTFDKEKLKKLPVTITPLSYEWKRSALGVKATDTGGEKTTVAAKV